MPGTVSSKTLLDGKHSRSRRRKKRRVEDAAKHALAGVAAESASGRKDAANEAKLKQLKTNLATRLKADLAGSAAKLKFTGLRPNRRMAKEELTSSGSASS